MRSAPSAASRDEHEHPHLLRHPPFPATGAEAKVVRMTLRADHVAGATFIAFGILIIALSGDLPMGNLSMPGAGFMPKILAVITIFFGAVLVARAAESLPISRLSWSDGKHAVMVIVITAAAIALFERLGFLTTMVLMMFVLLVGVERRSMVAAAIFSLGVVLLTYVTFEYVLRTPLVTGPLGF